MFNHDIDHDNRHDHDENKEEAASPLARSLLIVR
eukprot:COSAG01_NODE_55705_length_323_cov_0.906250_1_plen_33_part_01